MATAARERHHEPVSPVSDTVTLWRPIGPEELALVEGSGWREWPPRLPAQPIFYPVLNEEYAARIARDWNIPHSGAGYVTRFQVLRSFLNQYEVHQVGGKTILEWSTGVRLCALNASRPLSDSDSYRTSPVTLSVPRMPFRLSSASGKPIA